MSGDSLESILKAFDKTRLGHPDDPDDPIDPSESDGAENISPNHEARQPAASKSPAVRSKTFGEAKSSSKSPGRPGNNSRSSRGSIDSNRTIEALMASLEGDPWSLASFRKAEEARRKLDDEDTASYVVVGLGGVTDQLEEDAEEFELLEPGPIPSEPEMMRLALEDLRKAREEDSDDAVLIDERELVVPPVQPETLEKEFEAAYPGLLALDKTRILRDLKAQINADGPIGTINGFTLGSLSGYPRNEEDINSAWGEAVFLLNYLARHFEYRFQRYVLNPRGNRSYIENLESRSSKLPLYLLGQPSPIAEVVYDNAQMAFLNCMKQLEAHLKLRHSSFQLAYPISGNQTLYDRWERKAYLITKRGNLDSSWTGALKYMLSDLKQFLYVFMRKHRDRLRNLSS